MLARTTMKHPDSNQTAAHAIAHATHGEFIPTAIAERPKNRAAVALGRLGGKKGGLARAASLTPAQRKEIGRKGALARWGAAQ